MKSLFILIGLLYFSFCQWDIQDYGVIIDSTQRSKYYWGTYKPNLYFAMKNKANTSSTIGLMWYGADLDSHKKSGNISQRIRHNCKMSDELKYRWEVHNSIDYGRQVIDDQENSLLLTTLFEKIKYTSYTNQTWQAEVIGAFNPNNNLDINPKNISVIIYSSLENFKVTDGAYYKFDESKQLITFIEGTKEVYYVKIASEGKVLLKSHQLYRKKYEENWRVKKFFAEDLEKSELSRNQKIGKSDWNYASFEETNQLNKPNILAFQFILEVPFKINIYFSTNIEDLKDINPINTRKREDLFENKFNEVYQINYENLPFIKSERDKILLKEMSKHALSNLLGGIGYFWGEIKINLGDKVDKGGYHKGFRYAVEPKGLLSATPSRSFFARGFLWDEGFHNIIISQWNMELSIEIIDSWFSTMSATGWMAREQIRGKEAESQVPDKFIIQDKMMANPPTLVFAIENVMNYFKFHGEEKNLKSMKGFLKKCFDKISSWYEWFETYQKSSADRQTYQWYGRDTDHNLASGLDDYPRGMTPNIYEKHLDAYCWIIELMRSVKNLAEIFDFELVGHFNTRINKMKENLMTIYFDKNNKILNDFVGPQFKLIKVNSFKRPVPPYLWRGDKQCGDQSLNPIGGPADCNPYSDSPCCSEFGWCGSTKDHCNCPKCKKAQKLEDNKEYNTKESIFSPHIGYVNLFPLMFGYLKTDSEVYKNTIKLLLDESELYSEFGIRSLSKSDVLYRKGDDYWRGKIWVNLNFLTLKGLFKFYKKDSLAQEAYNKLRSNIIQTVYTEWLSSKMFYEQYCDNSGKGVKAHPFNGWTSLILNIITEKYDN